VHEVGAPLRPPPDQPAICHPLIGCAVRTSLVPVVMFSVQSLGVPLPQLMPMPVTAPEPVTLTVSGAVDGRVKVAVTLCAWFIVTEHAPVPEQAPPHPVEVEGALAVAVNASAVPTPR